MTSKKLCHRLMLGSILSSIHFAALAQTVIDLARRRGIEVVERAIWPEELESFEQFFLTGSAAEVTPVSEAGPWRFDVGALTLQLRRDYLDLVHRRIPNS